MKTKTFTFLMAFLISTTSLLSQEREINKDGNYKGVIRIKIENSLVKEFDELHQKKTHTTNKITQSGKGYVKTNVETLDAKNAEFGAKEYKRVFREAGKFEKRHRAFGLHKWYEITFDSKAKVNQLVDEYSKIKEVDVAEALPKMELFDKDPDKKKSNSTKSLTGGANDPRYDEQWHYHNTGQTGGTEDADIDLPEAWEKETGNTDVVVAIEDEGVDYEHEDLEGNMWVNPDETPNGEDSDNNGYVDDIHGYNFASDKGEIEPGDHGTHVGGTVAAETNNGTGVAGVAGGSGNDDGVRLMSVQVFEGYGNGGFEEALIYSADMGAHVSQNSWGGGGESQAINDAIDYFNENGGSADSPMDGGVVVFAAGNDDANSGAGTWPAQYEGAVAVASTDHNDKKSSFSNYGDWVDISAPGSDILSCKPNDAYQGMSGTSMACPHVSGVAALIVSNFAGNITPSEVRSKLIDNTDPIDDLNPNYSGQLGSGRLNADKALGDGEGNEEPPVADFSANSTTIEEGQTVDFTDQSSNYPTQWEWSFEGGDPSTSNEQNPSVTYENQGTYEVSLTVSNEYGSDSETKTDYITVEEYVPEYCDSEGEDASYEWIDEVQIGDFTNNSGEDNGYGDYTGQTVELAAGESHNITLTPGFSGSTYQEYWKIWIDFNDDKEFDDSELVYDAGSTSSSEVTGTIDIPSDASGETRMRVTMKYDGEPTACETFSYGEVEDYTVSFTDGDDEDTEAPTAPENLEASNIEETSLDLSWDASTDNVGVDHYTIYQNGNSIGTTDNTSYNVTGLSAATTYTFTVKAEDAAGNVSDPSNEVEATTEEEEEDPGSYCESKGEDASYEWISNVEIGSFSNESGSAGYSDFTDQTIELTAGSSYDITLTPDFSGSTYQEYWKIWIDFNGDKEFTSDELVYDAGSTSSSAVSGSIDIPSDASGSTRLRVTMKYNGEPTACETFSYGEVEDYTVSFSGDSDDTESPTAPTNLASSNVTETSVDLTWDASSDNVGVDQYTIYQDGESIGTTENTSYNVTGLSAATTYTFTVKAEDAAGNVSDPSNAIDVTTDESTVTYCESYGQNTNYEWIDLVELGAINNSTSSDGGYGDYTNLSTDLSPGSNPTIYVSAGFASSSYTEYWHVWIDFNQNGEFESDEEVVSGS
ncbi:MAG: S8 family serine peptidase, partial [Bacteroidota bacterium]